MAQTLNSRINPWFLTGFTDAEGSFIIKIQSNEQLRTRWRVRPVFSITLHIKDLSLLEDIQKTLGVGKISKSKNLSAVYAVDSITEIPIVIAHFDKYPLITQKKSDYLLFRQCFEIIKQKGHLTEKGLLDIVSIKSSLNLGLSEELNKAFPNITLTPRPASKFLEIPDPY